MRRGDRLDALRPGTLVTAKPPTPSTDPTEPSSAALFGGPSPVTGPRFSVSNKACKRREIAKIEPPGKIGDFYDFGNILGQGGFSIVSEILHSKTFDPFAGKVVEKEYLRDHDDSEKRFRDVIETLLNNEHAFVVKMRHVFEDESNYYQVMAACQGGTLRKFMKNESIMVSVIEKIIEQVCSGLSFLHGLRLIHRDIKPDNVMLVGGPGVVDGILAGTTGIVVNIVDFDMCSFMDENKTVIGKYVEGTPGYMAPEVLKERRYTVQSDLFSFGCLVYFLAKREENIHACSTTHECSTNRASESPQIGHMLADLYDWLAEVAKFCKYASAAGDRSPSGASVSDLGSPANDVSRSTSTAQGDTSIDIPAKVWRLVSWCLDKEASKRPISANDVLRSGIVRDSLASPGSCGSGETASAKENRKNERKCKKAGSALSIPLPPGMIPDS